MTVTARDPVGAQPVEVETGAVEEVPQDLRGALLNGYKVSASFFKTPVAAFFKTVAARSVTTTIEYAKFQSCASIVGRFWEVGSGC